MSIERLRTLVHRQRRLVRIYSALEEQEHLKGCENSKAHAAGKPLPHPSRKS